MEDRGMTREEGGSVKQTIAKLRISCEQLHQSVSKLEASLPAHPERAGAAGEKWIQLADAIARQIRSLGDDTAPLLDHWVFEPVDPGPPNEPLRLPELLRTKMREEQEQRDNRMREEIKQENESMTLQQLAARQTKTNESVTRILNELNDSKTVDNIISKKQRVVEKIASQAAATAKRAESVDATPLLRLLKQNDRKGIKTEEVDVVIDTEDD